MTGFPLYALLYWAALRSMPSELPAHLQVSRATVLALVGPAVVLSALARLGISGGAGLGLAVLAGLTAGALVVAARSRSNSDRSVYLVSAMACAAAILCPRPDIGPASVARDPFAHLAWSRDLVASGSFYVPGMPAFLSTLTMGGALEGAFRIAPGALLAAFFLTVVAFGRSRGWTAGGLAGCAALVSIPVLTGRLAPALPELMAYPIIVASWMEALALPRRMPHAATWLGFLTGSLVLTHVSFLEIVHLAGLGLYVLVAGGVDAKRRILALAAMGLGTASALAMAPVLLAMLRGEELLLVQGQPSALSPFSLRDLGGGWGLGFDLSLLLTALAVAARGRAGAEAWRSALPFAGVAALLLLPLVLRSAGIDVPLQLFAGRLYAAAAIFAVLGWVSLLGSIRPRWPRYSALAAVLPLAGVIVAFRGYPEFAGLVLLATIAAGVAGRISSRGLAIRGAFVAGVLVVAMAARLLVWWPQDPGWIRALREVDSRGGTLLTHWPAFNAAQARTDFEVEVGLAGADAGLPLHAITAIPPLRDDLTWTPQSREADRAALLSWLLERPGTEVFVLVHRDIDTAWTGYRTVFERLRSNGLPPGHPVFRAEPVDLPPEERRRLIGEAVSSLGASEVVHEDQEATVYRVDLEALRRNVVAPAG